ncbi:methyltransferase small domain-containing protein [Blastomyces gilchristii SLH14081]|uniref:Methyltransferase small domain-containing protein n=1 Tax=Blastomyces gilchristii (strain SLH14081) TaxID=559298 RepID=A0A179UKH4_BLAGS|nr:methyltransferase small domain-containing protein [Blastomyces gilchristii SLH14081]OAT07728.1 methyltransferase small domain-containing protein [Blastomyces gilchristii SLH14081]
MAGSIILASQAEPGNDQYFDFHTPDSYGKKGKQIQYMDTIDAYDRWAEVYDTDGNFLQALDTLEMQSLLPRFHSLLETNKNGNNDDVGPKLIDLGCGTGRNTVPLTRTARATAMIVGLEPSSKMLQTARDRVSKFLGTKSTESFASTAVEATEEQGAGGVLSAAIGNADGVISTLVMEHVPLDQFFGAAAGMLKRGGVLLVTNMHSEMGSISQAGFVDPNTGVKIRPTSYTHTVEEMVEAAEKVGFEVLGDIKEVRIDEDLAGKLGKRARKWYGVLVWYGGNFRKK